MEDLIVSLLPQMPVVGVLLAVGMIIRNDVNNHLTYLEKLIDTLIEVVTKDQE